MSDFVGKESAGRDRPFRSRRIKPYYTLPFANNYAVFRGSRGVYRIEAVSSDPTAAVADVFFAVGRDEQVLHFTAAVSRTVCLAENLPLSGYCRLAATTNHSLPLSPVEVDVEDGEVIWFWNSTGNAILKIVKVGVLPLRDPGVSDRERP